MSGVRLGNDFGDSAERGDVSLWRWTLRGDR
jgi:hypothetical protein